MLASIIDAVSFVDKNGKTVTNFGILDAARPRNDKGFANGLTFGVKNAKLLRHAIDNGLADQLDAYIEAYDVKPEPVTIPTPEPVKPVVSNPFPSSMTQAVKPAMPANTPKAPAVHNPGPSKATLDETPVKTAEYGGKRYGLFRDGTTRVFVAGRGKKPHWKKAQVAISWDAPTAPSVKVDPPKPVSTVASTPSKPVLREVCDGDTLIILYVDGTYKLVNMAVNA